MSALLQALFYSFDITIDTSLLLGALVILVSTQIFLLARKTNVKRKRRQPDASRAAKVLKNIKTSATTAPDTNKEPPVVDPELFSRFQNNLSKETDTSVPVTDEEEDVIVSISSKNPQTPRKEPKREVSGNTASVPGYGIKTAKKLVDPTTSKPATDNLKSLQQIKQKIPVESIGGLFDDVKESLETEPPATNLDAEAETSNQEPSRPIASNEFLTSKDLTPDRETTEEGVHLVLKTARNEYEQEKYEESLATIRQFLNSEEKSPRSPDQTRQLLELKGFNEFELEQYDRSSKTLQEVVTNYVTKNSPEFLTCLETYIDKFLEMEQQRHAIHFMFTALNEYRQLHDHAKMDKTYDEIEDAYRQLEDWPRLIQTYQNHLSIKKVLKDYEGQLDLLDHLGKLLYDQGEEDKSRKCYKQRLVIEKEMARATGKG